MTTNHLHGLPRDESLRSRVERLIALAINSGELAPEIVVSTPTLAAQFGVSATPVREALLNLEKRGLVVAVRNKGFRVTEVDQKSLAEIVAVRRLLEPPAMRELAGVFPGDGPELRDLLARIAAEAHRGDLNAYLEADGAFHLRLTSLLGNDLLVEMVGDLRGRTRLAGLKKLLNQRDFRRLLSDHEELLDALGTGDGTAAEEIMTRHIDHVLGWWSGRDEDTALPAADAP